MASRGYDYYVRCKITVTSQVVHNKNIITMATSTLYSSTQLKYITFPYNNYIVHPLASSTVWSQTHFMTNAQLLQ